jgi:hypothetical protein
MRLELDSEECRELMAAVVERLLTEAKFSKADSATLKRWRSESMKPGSEGMKELTAKINAEIERTLSTRAKSAIMRPDWR